MSPVWNTPFILSEQLNWGLKDWFSKALSLAALNLNWLGNKSDSCVVKQF